MVNLREEIKDDIIANGWNDEVGSFTTAYDGTDIDASVLAIGLFGMLEHDDPRYIATVHAVESSLRTGDTVYRYKHEDGLPGEEGGFNLMTSWLIDAKIRSVISARPASSSVPTSSSPDRPVSSPKRSTRPPGGRSATTRRRTPTSGSSRTP